MGNNYKFKIIAINSAGPSILSAESNFIIAAVPPGAPTNIVRLNADQTFITIGWDKPSSNGGTPIIGYKILWDAGQGGISYTQIGVSTLDTQIFTISNGLVGGNKYYFQVIAFNVIRDSVPSTASYVIAANYPD